MKKMTMMKRMTMITTTGWGWSRTFISVSKLRTDVSLWPALVPPLSALILPRALKGKFRKVSGMLGALGTPERRAVRRVLELARNKSSYFGCLVQDYVSFMQENGAGVDNGLHTSAVDLLQTVRHFMTQMKAYLVHSSELQPPMESFVPEEQIGNYIFYIILHLVDTSIQSDLQRGHSSKCRVWCPIKGTAVQRLVCCNDYAL